MPSERENLVRDIDGLKDRIQLVWRDTLSKPMTAGERQELRDSLESLVRISYPAPARLRKHGRPAASRRLGLSRSRPIVSSCVMPTVKR